MLFDFQCFLDKDEYETQELKNDSERLLSDFVRLLNLEIETLKNEYQCKYASKQE